MEVCWDMASCCTTLSAPLEPRLRMEPSVRPARKRPWSEVCSRSFHWRLALTLVGCEFRNASGMSAFTSPAVWPSVGAAYIGVAESRRDNKSDSNDLNMQDLKKSARGNLAKLSQKKS